MTLCDINSPDDLKKLKPDQLQAIADELGVSQSYISKVKVKLSKKLSEMYK